MHTRRSDVVVCGDEVVSETTVLCPVLVLTALPLSALCCHGLLDEGLADLATLLELLLGIVL